MLNSTLFLSLLAATTVGNQFSFTIWDWEPAYRDMEFFKRQIDTVVGYGVNTIELGVSWRDCEPSDNTFDFSVPGERIAYVQSKNLALRLRVNVTDWPEWFRPELFQNPDGSTFDYSGGLPSVFSANNREHQLRFAAAVAQRYAGQGFAYTPAFSVHMEVKFGGWNAYEPSARAAFRAWLAGRYSSIASLNESWGAAYASFGEIGPPVPQNTTGGPSTDAASADWIRVREAALTDWVAAFAATVRKRDPSARISVPLGESFRSESAAFANLAYWNYSRPADEIVHSYDFFMHGPRHVDDVGLATAIMTGITRRPTVIEIDGPILVEQHGYTPEHLVTAAARARANGAEGVQITNWGSTDLSAQSWIGEIGKALQKPPAIVPKQTPPILYYVSKWQNYCARDATIDMFEKQFGALRKLLGANSSVRVVTDENLLHEDYRANTMFVPFAEAMDGSVREELRSLSWGMRIVAASKPGIYTPTAKTGGNYGARIDVIGSSAPDDANGLVKRLTGSENAPRLVRVAAVQFHTCFDVASNTKRIIEWIGKAAGEGARVVAFSEMALTGYTKKAEFRDTLDSIAIDESIGAIAGACKSRNIYAILGAPTREGDAIFCAALTIDPNGEIIDRYEKTYLAGEAWATPGRRLTTFAIDDAKCGAIICHDERYPHLVQLRALAGAQLFFYISCESGVGEEHKIGPYRAQLQARAVENGVYIVHSNAPALRDDPNADGTSNGHSRIVGPDGNLIREAGAYDEAMVIADIDLRHASESGRPAALENGPTAEWMRKGLELLAGE